MYRYVLIFILGMARIVHVHHMDKEAFLRGNTKPDPDEIDLVFDRSPNYAEVLQQIQVDLNWMDPSDVVELEGRHNVGFGMHNRWKTMVSARSNVGLHTRKWWPNHKTKLLSYLPRKRLMVICKGVSYWLPP